MPKEQMLGLQTESSDETRIIRRDRDVYDVHKNGRTYTIFFGRHAPRDPDIVPKDISAIVFESPKFPWEKFTYEDKKTESEYLNREYLGNFKDGSLELEQVFKRVQEQGYTQIVVVDPVIYKNYIEVYPKYLGLAELAAGVFTGASAIKNNLRASAPRRSVLRGGLKLLAGAYLSMPAVAGALYVTQGNQGEFIPPEYREWALEKSHPEIATHIIPVRNELIAEKVESVAPIVAPRNEKIGVVITASHINILKSFARTHENRMRKLSEPLNKFTAQRAYVRPSVYKTAIFKFNGRYWDDGRIVENQEIKNLLVA